jgi:hypothetical protein
LDRTPKGQLVMSDSKTFHGVTPAIFDCLKATSEKDHGTKYVPPTANQGTATTEGTGWTVVLNFNYTPATQDLTYTIVKTTWIVPTSSIWDGISDTINGCRKKTM